MLLRSDVQGFRNRVFVSRGGIWIPLFDAFVGRARNILAVLGRADGRVLIPASNIITDAGDVWYAQQAAGEAVTNAFGVHELGTGHSAPWAKGHTRANLTGAISGSQKSHTGGYPTTSDADADNTGAGADVVTFAASYAKGDFSATGIADGIITNATPGASEPVLSGYAFAASFDKTGADTLKIFVNHTMNGV